MILKLGPKLYPRGSFARQQKLHSEKRIDFGGSRKKPPARVTKNTAQNRRWMPPNSPLIKRAKPTSFGQRDMKNIALRLAARSIETHKPGDFRCGVRNRSTSAVIARISASIPVANR